MADAEAPCEQTQTNLNVKRFAFKDLESYTNNFSKENYLGNFQYGKLFRGKIGDKEVVVKKWGKPLLYFWFPGDNARRLEEELILHGDSRIASHPNIAKLIGYAHDDEDDENMGVVYDFKARDTLLNLVQRADFTWLPRVKVAYEFAQLLEFLHNPPDDEQLPYIVRNLDLAHILLDENDSPMLCDFGMFTGGVLPDDKRNFLEHGQYTRGTWGYIDYGFRGYWYPEFDVFGYAMILIGLIAKRVFIPEDHIYGGMRENVPDDELPLGIIRYTPLLHDWVIGEYKRRNTSFRECHLSFVHNSLKEDANFEPDDDAKITELLVHCLVKKSSVRADMDEVVCALKELQVMQKNAAFFGIKPSRKRSYADACALE